MTYKGKQDRDYRGVGSKRVLAAHNTWLSQAYKNVPAKGEVLTVNSPELVAMGIDGEHAEDRLRSLTRDGVLKMNSMFDEDGKFIQFVWTVR